MNEAEWLSAADATELWAFVRSRTEFNRRMVDTHEPEYNQCLLYLLGAAACRRIQRLFPDPCCHRMLEVAEAYAEGRATEEELSEAHEVVDVFWCSRASNALPAANSAAVGAVFWLCPDDYKVIRAVGYISDVAGYLRAVAEGVLPANATHEEGEAVWRDPTFLAGKREEENSLCHLIREVIGNPFRPAVLPPSCLVWNDGAVRKLAQAIYGGGAFDRLPLLADALEDAGCTDAALLAHCRSGGGHVRGCWVVDLLLGKG